MMLARSSTPVARGVDERGERDHRGAVLVIVQHRLCEPLTQRLLDLEAFGRGEVLELDRAEGGRDAATLSTTRAGSVSLSRIGTPLMPTRSANSAALPSITGKPASAPMLPRPSTAVPFVTMATVLSRAVYSCAVCGSFWIARHTRATPGV